MNSDAKENFHALFREHYEQGTGLNPSTPPPAGWTDPGFHGAFSTAAKQIKGRERTLADGMLLSWLEGRHYPQRNTMQVILRVFFPDVTGSMRRQGVHPAYDELFDAWEAGAHKPPGASSRAPEDGLAEEGWLIDTDMAKSRGLCELTLHEPRSANEPGAYYLDLTLRIEPADHDFDDHEVVLGLRAAFLGYESKGYQAAKGSWLGERAPHDFARPAPHGVRFDGPLDEQGRLCGDLVGDDYLALVKTVGDVHGLIVVSLHAARKDFSVEIKPSLGREEVAATTTVEQRAVLDALLFNACEKDDQGRAILARSRLRKKKIDS